MTKKRPQTIESLTADAVLERHTAITIGGVEYIVAPPTLATLILVSEEVSYLPNITFDKEATVADALRDARFFRGLADIAAILILGAQRLVVEEEQTYKLWGIIPRKRKVKVDMKKRIAEAMMNVRMSELSKAVATMLSMLETEHFFALATFLTNINLTKPTKVAKTTVCGQ
jgi:hypothetical protein